MSIEQSKEALLEQLEALKKENEQLRKELSTLRDEKYNDRPVSFKEKYAVRILDSLPDMLTVFNQSEVGIEVVSNEETNHVGISNKDFRGMRMQDMVPPEAYQNIHSNMRHAITTGTVSTAHHELDFNGERHYYENRIFPLDEEYVLIMCRDITERVATQRQLEVFKSVLDKVSDSILAVAGDGTLVYANKQFIEEYGVTQELGTQKVYDLRVSMTDRGAWEKRLQEIRDNDGSFAYRAAYIPYGHTDYEIFPVHGDAEKFRKDDLELLQTHKRIDMQETYLSANGEARIVQTLKALVPMEGRKPLLIGISWDITNLQNIEQELIKARIKAEQSDRLKSAFLANMSHEIRTPLNAIVGFSQLLPSAETAEEKKLYSGIINQNSDILLQLINDILDLSKIEAGTLEYIKRPMNLGEVCRTIYTVHKERVKEGVTLVFDNEEEDLLMEGDQNRIMQVITNFLTNASKFTYEGEIRLGFGRMDKDIRVYVKDTGIGIEPEKVDHIFERFVKLNSFAQGTGLGLSICRMIIEKIGGEIGVTSELGKGSTFYFTIPYEETGEHGKFFKESKVVSKGNTVNRVQQIKKILVAEDVESNFILLKNLIGREYTLLWAKDGVEAIEMYKQYQPDLILMDVKMPRMDGLEATHIIRSYSKEIPIIALTAYAFEADKELALEMGCNDFVTKPISERTLRKALDKYSTTV